MVTRIIFLFFFFLSVQTFAQKIHTQLHTGAISVNDDGIPTQEIKLLMPNKQRLLIANAPNRKDIRTGEWKNLGIPKNAVYAFHSFYAGVTTYHYAVFTKANELDIYEQYVEEDGSKSDPEHIKKYILKNNTWELSPKEETPSWVIYRNQNWNPEKGQYYFSEQFIYSYLNEQFSGDDPRHKGVFSFFHDPITGSILLTRGESFTDEMTKYVLIRPKKDYIVAYQGEHKSTIIDTIPQDGFYKNYTRLYEKDIQSSFQENFNLKVDSTRVFGKDDPNYCLSELIAKDWKVSYQTNDQTSVSLAEYPFDLTNLYLLGISDAMPENGLLINLSGWQIPGNFLLTQEKSIVNGKKITCCLTCISATGYHLYINPK